MSNKGIDVDSIVGDDFSDLSPEDMALLTGRGSNDAAPQSLSMITPEFLRTFGFRP